MFIVYPGFNYLPVFRNTDEDNMFRDEFEDYYEYNDIFKAADDEYIRGYTMKNNNF